MEHEMDWNDASDGIDQEDSLELSAQAQANPGDTLRHGGQQDAEQSMSSDSEQSQQTTRGVKRSATSAAQETYGINSRGLFWAFDDFTDLELQGTFQVQAAETEQVLFLTDESRVDLDFVRKDIAEVAAILARRFTDLSTDSVEEMLRLRLVRAYLRHEGRISWRVLVDTKAMFLGAAPDHLLLLQRCGNDAKAIG